MANHEVWKDIPGCQDYQASSLGRIRSLDRVISPKNGSRHWKSRHCKGKVLSMYRQPNGYLAVSLGSKTHYLVHQLVALTFLGSPPPGMEVCHNNGKRDDNRLENLRYDTRKNNHADCLEHGTRLRGERHYKTKITEAQAREIKNSRLRERDLVRQSGVSRAIIKAIRNGNSWVWLDAEDT